MSPKVSIETIERRKERFALLIKGTPETKEQITMEGLKASVDKAVYAYMEKHVGPRERVGKRVGGRQTD